MVLCTTHNDGTMTNELIIFMPERAEIWFSVQTDKVMHRRYSIEVGSFGIQVFQTSKILIIGMTSIEVCWHTSLLGLLVYRSICVLLVPNQCYRMLGMDRQSHARHSDCIYNQIWKAHCVMGWMARFMWFILIVCMTRIKGHSCDRLYTNLTTRVARHAS